MHYPEHTTSYGAKALCNTINYCLYTAKKICGLLVLFMLSNSVNATCNFDSPTKQPTPECVTTDVYEALLSPEIADTLQDIPTPIKNSTKTPKTSQTEHSEKSSITLSVYSYSNHDEGKQCKHDKDSSNYTIQDQQQDRIEKLTHCFLISNQSTLALSDMQLIKNGEIIPTSNLIPVQKEIIDVLQPFEVRQLFLETEIKNSETIHWQVSATYQKENETIEQQQAYYTSRIQFILNEPIVNKNVLPQGGRGMLWETVLINSQFHQNTLVEFSDEIPKLSEFTPLTQGKYISEDGIYCETTGHSETIGCYYEPPSSNYKRGRIVWKGHIASDLDKLTKEVSEHAVTIRFSTQSLESQIGDVISSQAITHWDSNHDDQTDLETLSDNPTTTTNNDATTYIIHRDIREEEHVFTIPTMNQLMLLIVSLLLLISGSFNIRKRGK